MVVLGTQTELVCNRNNFSKNTVSFIVEMSVAFSVEKNATLISTLNSTNLDTLRAPNEIRIHGKVIFTPLSFLFYHLSD